MLLDFINTACESPKELVVSGAWTKIVNLKSLTELNLLLPNEFLKTRNLLQLLLAEAIFSLVSAKENALAMADVDEEDKMRIQSQELPFEDLYMTMKHTKQCLKDKYLFGSIRSKV